MQNLDTLDRYLSARLALYPKKHALRVPILAIAHSGDSPLWLLAAIVALVWGDAFWQGLGGRVVLGTLAAGAATTALKWVFRRPRPPGKSLGFYSQFDRHAFPSGHAGRCASLVILLSPPLPLWGVALLTLWAGLVGLARVALQVHFVSDVIAGWIVGLSIGLVLLLLL